MKKLLLLTLALGIGLAAGCSPAKDTTPVEIKGQNPRGGAAKKADK